MDETSIPNGAIRSGQPGRYLLLRDPHQRIKPDTHDGRTFSRRVAITIAATLFVAPACTSIRVHPIQPGLKITEVCIEENPRVIVEDFLTVVREGFDRHGIVTKVVTRPAPSECEFVLTYTAFKTWDFATYLHHAELRLESHGRLVGSAEYHLAGKGGLSLMKWQSTRTKIDPVVDQLLGNSE